MDLGLCSDVAYSGNLRLHVFIKRSYLLDIITTCLIALTLIVSAPLALAVSLFMGFHCTSTVGEASHPQPEAIVTQSATKPDAHILIN